MTHLCVFRVGDLLLGLPVSEVEQVLHGPVIHPLPQAPPAVVGLVNLRGRVVTVVRSRRLLGLAGEDVASVHLVVLRDGAPVSLIVDDVREVVEVDLDRMRAVPAHLPPALHRAAVGVVCRDDDLVLVVSADVMLRALRDAA